MHFWLIEQLPNFELCFQHFILSFCWLLHGLESKMENTHIDIEDFLNSELIAFVIQF